MLTYYLHIIICNWFILRSENKLTIT